jgi:hypothetical protein
MLVFLAAAPAYKAWKKQNPGKDAKHEFPGFDLTVLRKHSAPFKPNRPLSTDEVAQHCVLLTEKQLLGRQPSREVRDQKDYHFTLTAKGEAVYDRLATAQYAGKTLLPALLLEENSKLWTAFVVLAWLARPKSDSLTDAQIAAMTGLTDSSVKAGRKMAAQGITARAKPGSTVLPTTFPKAQFEEDRDGHGEVRRCLHKDQWVLDGVDLTDVVAALASAPVPPAPPAPAPVAEPDPEPVKAADPKPKDRRIVPREKKLATQGAVAVQVWLTPDEHAALAESVNGSTIEEYLLGFVQKQIQGVVERKAKRRRLDALRARRAEIEAEEQALAAELGA